MFIRLNVRGPEINSILKSLMICWYTRNYFAWTQGTAFTFPVGCTVTYSI